MKMETLIDSIDDTMFDMILDLCNDKNIANENINVAKKIFLRRLINLNNNPTYEP